jgi:hypothetical protein
MTSTATPSPYVICAGSGTTPADIHSCSYYCERPACIKAQRDELRARVAELERQYEPIAWQWLDSMQIRRKLPGDAETGAWRRVYAKPYRFEG